MHAPLLVLLQDISSPLGAAPLLSTAVLADAAGN